MKSIHHVWNKHSILVLGMFAVVLFAVVPFAFAHAQASPGDVTLPVIGCTDPSANNFDSTATVNVGCEYTGCTDPLATNFNPFAVTADDSCEYTPARVIEGCTDDSALNYNPLANTDDDSCLYETTILPVISGCTDDSALNYNPLASVDDDSCIYDTSAQTQTPLATIVTHSIVCTDESELPNWGGHFDTPVVPAPAINSTTASTWVAEHDSCDFASGWNFEWVHDADMTDPGDVLIGPAGSPWTLFDPTEVGTDANGILELTFTEEDLSQATPIWFREVLKDGYIAFTHDQNGNTNIDTYSAEYYCEQDIHWYDNLEVIGLHSPAIELDETYYCVAWNVPVVADEEVDVCLNIDGLQSSLPDGYEFESENVCILIQGGGPLITSGGGGSCRNCGNDDSPEGDVEGDSDTRDNNDTDDSSTSEDTDDAPQGIVEGDQVSIIPIGAPNAGGGGMSPSTSQTIPFISMLGMLFSFAILRTIRVNE